MTVPFPKCWYDGPVPGASIAIDIECGDDDVAANAWTRSASFWSVSNAMSSNNNCSCSCIRPAIRSRCCCCCICSVWVATVLGCVGVVWLVLLLVLASKSSAASSCPKFVRLGLRRNQLRVVVAVPSRRSLYKWRDSSCIIRSAICSISGVGSFAPWPYIYCCSVACVCRNDSLVTLCCCCTRRFSTPAFNVWHASMTRLKLKITLTRACRFFLLRSCNVT